MLKDGERELCLNPKRTGDRIIKSASETQGSLLMLKYSGVQARPWQIFTYISSVEFSLWFWNVLHSAVPHMAIGKANNHRELFRILIDYSYGFLLLHFSRTSLIFQGHMLFNDIPSDLNLKPSSLNHCLFLNTD